MKNRSPYWWIFIISGAITIIGFTGLAVGMRLYPDSNLLGGLGPLFGPLAGIGSNIFIITLLVWIIHRIIKWISKPKTNSEGQNK